MFSLNGVEILQMLRNVGWNVECVACMEIAFTGAATSQHECEKSSKRNPRIFVTDSHGNRQEITDLYFFEEEGIHDFSGRGSNENYLIELWIADRLVYSSVEA